MTSVPRQPGEPLPGPVVIGIYDADASIRLRGDVELSCRPCIVRGGHQMLYGRLASGLQVQPILHVMGILAGCLAELGDADLVVSLLDGGESFSMQPVGRAAYDQDRSHECTEDSARKRGHGEPPTESCCCIFRGLYVTTSCPLTNESMVYVLSRVSPTWTSNTRSPCVRKTTGVEPSGA